MEAKPASRPGWRTLEVVQMSTARNKHSVRYKPRRLASDKTNEDLLSGLKDFNKFCLEAIRSKPFWSPTDKVVFTDKWTVFMQNFLSHGTSLHGFNHRLILDDDNEGHEEVKQ
jgi:hypothetical protein